MKKAVGKVTSLSGELFNHLQKKKDCGSKSNITIYRNIYRSITVMEICKDLLLFFF